jgi:hypothetical protein
LRLVLILLFENPAAGIPKNDSNFDIWSFVLVCIVYAIVIVCKATNRQFNTSYILTTLIYLWF